MRMGIKSKIISSVALIISLALIVSGTYAYYYFNIILKKQVMKDEAIKLKQTAVQIQFIQEDIRKFAQYILVDNEIQTRINAVYSSDSFEKIASEDWISQKLKSYLLLKDYIDSIVIVSKNGEAVSSDNTANDYFISMLQENWYRNFLDRHVNFGFTELHMMNNRQQIPVKAISYVIKFNSMLNPSSKQQFLIINLNLDYILQMLEKGSTDYDDYYLLNAQNNILYKNGDEHSKFVIESFLKRVGNQSTYEEENANQIIHFNQMMDDQWKLITVKSKNSVLEQNNFIFYFFALSTMLSILAILLVLTPIILNITKPLFMLTNAMKQVTMGKWNIRVSIKSKDELELLGEGFNRMLDDIQNFIHQSIENEKIKQKLQFDLLLSQINPHFIYNTLNTVIYMAHRNGNQDIVTMMESFIHILQDAVKDDQNGYYTSVNKEIKNVQNYIVIQNYRYPNRFQVNWQVDAQILEATVPRTILQPLVENALFHGIIPQSELGTITIRIFPIRQGLEISVEDDGIGVSADLIKKFENGMEIHSSSSRMRPIGLMNVRDRIRGFYGDLSELHMENVNDKGTKITIRIPLIDTGFYTK